MTWITAAKKAATGCSPALGKAGIRSFSDQSRLAQELIGPGQTSLSAASAVKPTLAGPKAAEVARTMSSSSAARMKKKALDRDVIVSILESSTTKRDAKGYLQKYTAKPATLPPTTSVPSTTTQVTTTEEPEEKKRPDQATFAASDIPEPENVAIVMLREPQIISDDELDGIAKTLVQLRSLGLLSTVVLDCGLGTDREVFGDQGLRLCEAIDSYGTSGASLVNDIFYGKSTAAAASSSPSASIQISDRGLLSRTFKREQISIIPSLSCPDELTASRPADGSATVLALTKFLTGLQMTHPPSVTAAVSGNNNDAPKTAPQIASVERIIILDALGATPMSGRPGVCHRFINLEQEYGTLMAQLMGPDGSPLGDNSEGPTSMSNHAANLSLIRDTLSLLPPSASALVTTPYAAANSQAEPAITAIEEMDEPGWEFEGMVTTRKRQNALLHNLLTDKPLFSSSLPFQRVKNDRHRASEQPSTAATLVKVGVSLNIYPDPRFEPWKPAKPGAPRPRLTDTNIDLPRLVHLIQDSFGRELDVEDYLRRVQDNLAGVIIAGEYDGGAILTWEKPDDLTEQEAYDQGRYVPYLDKFAVLKCRQGSGGVADIVFNAMVRDCFPYGVCWRSRKNNPVNKWYFERSVGTNKLNDTNWTMFWTTPRLGGEGQKLKDYESVCRSVQPSWANNKHIVD